MCSSLERQVDSGDLNLFKRKKKKQFYLQQQDKLTEEFLSVCANYFVLLESGPSKLGWGMDRAQVDAET